MTRRDGPEDSGRSPGGSAHRRGDRRRRSGRRPGRGARARDAPAGGAPDERLEPCLRCGARLPLRWFGCNGGPCPNCGHAYPHGDCSD